MYQRLCNLSKSHSFFLFGARATGKSTLLLNFFKERQNQCLWIDLLKPEIEQELSVRPSKLNELIEGRGKELQWVIIDEIQKVPKSLDIAHSLIAQKKMCFAITGSSARKLKRGQANLLAGRAFQFKLYPLTFFELGEDFKLEEALYWGTLPELISLTSLQDKRRYLYAYVQTYIKEEILVEQIIRNIQPFRAFLEVAAQCNGEIVNFSKIARQASIDPKSVERYFEVLQDTLLGFFLEPYSRSIRKRQSQHPKFYFFDTGITRALSGELGTTLKPQTHGFGKIFEHLIILEIMRLNDYLEKFFKCYYLRTKDNLEIDLILEKGREKYLIEIKSTDKIIKDHLHSLIPLGKEFPGARKYVFSLEKEPRVIENIKIVHWQDGIREIFA